MGEKSSIESYEMAPRGGGARGRAGAFPNSGGGGGGRGEQRSGGKGKGTISAGQVPFEEMREFFIEVRLLALFLSFCLSLPFLKTPFC